MQQSSCSYFVMMQQEGDCFNSSTGKKKPTLGVCLVIKARKSEANRKVSTFDLFAFNLSSITDP